MAAAALIGVACVALFLLMLGAGYVVVWAMRLMVVTPSNGQGFAGLFALILLVPAKGVLLVVGLWTALVVSTLYFGFRSGFRARPPALPPA